MKYDDVIFVGIKRSVLSIERTTGKIVWQTELTDTQLGDTFVNIFFDAGNLYAHTKGGLYCLDAVTGRKKWENPLKGYGYGIATFASSTSFVGNPVAAIQKKMRDDAANGAAATASSSS